MKTSYSVTGLNQLKLLNTFNKEGISLKALTRSSNKLMTFTIKGADKEKAVAIMDKQGFEYEITSETSLKESIKCVLPRLGLVVGLVVMIVISALSTQYLWKIEVSGNDRIDSLTILRKLDANGISVGKLKNFDCDYVEETLMTLDDVSAVSCNLMGTTLKVDIVESVPVTAPKSKGDVISLYDAEVTRMTINRGTAKVKIGDRIPIGALLIEGKEYNTAGELLMNVDADGTVYGKVNFTYSEISSLSGGYERSGKVLKSTVIRFFGLNIGKEKVPEEGLYESETQITRIGSFFPLYAKSTYCYELIQRPDVELDTLKQKIADKAVNTLIIRAGGSAINTTVTAASIAENVYKVTVHIEAEIAIGGRID